MPRTAHTLFGVPKNSKNGLPATLRLFSHYRNLLRGLNLVSLETKLHECDRRLSHPDIPDSDTWGVILKSYARNEREHKKATNIQYCRRRWLVVEDEQGPSLRPYMCHERMCLQCQRAYSRKMNRKVNARFQAMQHPKFVTLTLKANDHTCDHESTRILRSFQRLRRTDFWKTHVKGGLWALEMVPRSDGRTHHVHLHALVDSRFLPVQLLSKKWLEITGDSWKVDVQKPYAKDPRYICKYVTKGVSALPVNANPWEHAERIHGRRMFGTFGSVASLTADDEPAPFKVHGTLKEILLKAVAGDQEAVRLLNAASDRFLRENPQPPPGGSWDDPFQ